MLVPGLSDASSTSVGDRDSGVCRFANPGVNLSAKAKIVEIFGSSWNRSIGYAAYRNAPKGVALEHFLAENAGPDRDADERRWQAGLTGVGTTPLRFSDMSEGVSPPKCCSKFLCEQKNRAFMDVEAKADKRSFTWPRWRASTAMLSHWASDRWAAEVAEAERVATEEKKAAAVEKQAAAGARRAAEAERVAAEEKQAAAEAEAARVATEEKQAADVAEAERVAAREKGAAAVAEAEQIAAEEKQAEEGSRSKLIRNRKPRH